MCVNKTYGRNSKESFLITDFPRWPGPTLVGNLRHRIVHCLLTSYLEGTTVQTYEKLSPFENKRTQTRKKVSVEVKRTKAAKPNAEILKVMEKFDDVPQTEIITIVSVRKSLTSGFTLSGLVRKSFFPLTFNPSLKTYSKGSGLQLTIFARQMTEMIRPLALIYDPFHCGFKSLFVSNTQ